MTAPMGILEVLTGPQEPQRAVEHVRLHVGHVSVFKHFIRLLSTGMNELRRQCKGELTIEGLFYPTQRPDVVELRVQVLKRSPKGRIMRACALRFHLQLTEQGLISEILSSTALPQGNGNHEV